MAGQLDQTLQPTVSVLGNLRRMRSGAIWADYRMIGLAYGYTSDERKYDALIHHKNLFRALPGNSVIAGLIAAMNPDEILARAMADTDLTAHPRWRDECEGKHEFFSSTARASERIFTLSFPVVEPDVVVMAGGGRRSRERDRAELLKAVSLAEGILARLPSVFDLEPLTASQMVWLWNRATSRGGDLEVFPSPVESNLSSPAGAFCLAKLDEGQRRGEMKKWKPHSFAPLMKITRPGRIGANESWQTLMAVESLPLEGLQFPGSEIFTIADQVPGFDIDWAVRINKTSREQAISRNTKNLRRLREQADERDSEVSFAQDTLGEQVALLAEYNGHLESNDDEIEVALCPIFAAAATTRAECEDGALKLVRAFERNRVKVVAPLGGQRELWAAMNPGGANLRVVSDFSHVTISEYAAASVPCTTSDVGDSHGPIVALNLSGKRNQPVHLAWWREAVKDASPSVAIAGELGAGKTWLIMSLLFNLVDTGGQFLAIDRTDSGEYAAPASTLPHHAIVNLMRPQWSMDPLRTFPADIGVDAAVELLTPLFECEPNSAMGMTLGELLHPQWGVRSIPDLLKVLQAGADAGALPDGKPLQAGWHELYRHLSYWSGRRYAAALFDPNLAPLPLDAEAIVIRTNRVEVPTAKEVAGGERIGPSKVFGRAVYGLSMELGRQAFHLNKARPASVALDEAYHVTSTPTGLARTERIARDGRKDNIALLLGSHDPVNDYPAGTALDLIPVRIVMRHRDRSLAERSLKWLGIDPEKNPHIVRDLTMHTSPKDGRTGRVVAGREGEGYLRDARLAIGRIKVLGPSSPARREAMTTTPPDYADIA